MNNTSARKLATSIAIGLSILSVAVAPGVAFARDQSLGADPNGRGSGIDPLGRDGGFLIDPNGRAGHALNWSRDDGSHLDPNGRSWFGGFLHSLFGWL